MTDNDLRCCSKCYTTKPSVEYDASNWARGGYCKSCQREYQRARRARLNPDIRTKRPDNRVKVKDKRYCHDCATYKTQADWSPVNWVTGAGYCRQCSNIRAKDYMARHPEYRGKIAQRREAAWQQIADIKMALGCRDCGYKEHPSALDFHHRVASEKKFAIGSRLVMSLETLLLEIAKCDLLCANCHRIHHYTERQDRKRAVADLTSTLGQ